MKINLLYNPTICFSVFRAVFGLLMIEQTLSLAPYVYDLQNSHIVLHYPNLEIIEAYSVLLIDVLKYTSIVGALLLALGILPRIGALLFLLAFGYLFMIDMSFYNNHYYLWCLLAFLFVVVDTQNSYSIIYLFNKKTKNAISSFAIQSFKILITIVYLYAAIVKINPDWLHGYPSILWFQARGFTNPKLFGIAMSYAGLFYDLSMPFLLWFFPRKIWVIIPYFAFHVANSILFNIGMFPFVMMAAWLLFAISDLKINTIVSEVKLYTKFQTIRLCVVALFILFNIVFPLRFLLYEGRTSWHRQGYYFSWRMMLDMYKSKDFLFKVVIPSKNINYLVDLKVLMNERQYANSYKDPYMIWFIAQILKKEAKTIYNVYDSDINVFNFSKIKLNQHPFKLIVNKNIDLASSDYKLLSNNKFITQ